MLEAYKILVSKKCLAVFYEVYCQWWFPRCDVTSSIVTGRPPCKEACEWATTVCAKELEMAKAFNKQQGYSRHPVKWSIIKCTGLKYRNGGDMPECYYPRELNSKITNLLAVWGGGVCQGRDQCRFLVVCLQGLGQVTGGKREEGSGSPF